MEVIVGRVVGIDEPRGGSSGGKMGISVLDEIGG
jgi:hypothetical protein